MRAGLALRKEGVPRNTLRWFAATSAGLASTAALYSAYGMVLVRDHAGRILKESALLEAYGMMRIVGPDDPYLTGLGHQIASALFFGLTLGVLCGMVCAAVFFPAWVRGRLTSSDVPSILAAAAACAYLGFSGERTAVSVLAGILCPLAFGLPWCLIARTVRPAVTPGPYSVSLMACAFLMPLAALVVSGSGFLGARDMLLTSPLLCFLNDFYYEHTLLAADVIKPAAERLQKVIALDDKLGPIGGMPHGTLWVRTSEPCLIEGASIRVSRGPLPCVTVVIDDTGPVNRKGRVFEMARRIFDPNRIMRGSIGFFLTSGPLVAFFVFVAAWLAYGAAVLLERKPAVAVVLVLVYLALSIHPLRQMVLYMRLARHPELVEEFAASADETMRYLAVASYPGAVSDARIREMMGDASARVRLHAAVEAGCRRSPVFLSMLDALAHDRQLNVRTKACWALGRIANEKSVSILESVIGRDPAWYVRDYAYAAIGRIRPEAREVHLDARGRL